MDELNEKNIDDYHKVDDDFIEEYSKMIKEHKNYLIREITKVIAKKIKGIEIYKIEMLIDRHLGTELEYKGKETIDTLSEEINEKYNSITTKLSGDIEDKNEIFKSYKEQMKTSLQRNQMRWISKTIDIFIETLINELKTSLKKTSDTADENLSVILDYLEKELTDILSKYINKFNQDYQTILKDFVSKKLEEMSDLLSNSKMDQKERLKLENYHTIIELSNHELIEEAGVFYIKDKKTQELSELRFEKKRLKSTDNKINYLIDEKQQGYINNKTNIRIVIHDGLITLVLLGDKKEDEESSKKQLISFTKTDHTYKFYHNGRVTKDLKIIDYMLKIIEKIAPGIYEKLICDLDFGSVLMMIRNYRKQQNIFTVINETKNELYKSNNCEDISSEPEIPKRK